VSFHVWAHNKLWVVWVIAHFHQNAPATIDEPVVELGEVQASDSHELLLLRLAWVRVVGVVLQPLLEHFDRAGRESLVVRQGLGDAVFRAGAMRSVVQCMHRCALCTSCCCGAAAAAALAAVVVLLAPAVLWSLGR